MRERNLFHLFLGLNVALAGAFVAYLFLAHSGQPKVVSTSFPAGAKTNASTNAALAGVANAGDRKTNAPPAALRGTNEIQTNALASVLPARPKPAFTDKKFTWEQVESEEYPNYLASLRAVGCPEERVRNIALADINDLFAKKRVKAAVEHDTQWWRSESEYLMVNTLQEAGRVLEEERRRLVARLLGPEAAENEKSDALLWSSVPLTGPVLGSLPPDAHNAVQEICARSLERQQGAWVRGNDGQPLNPVEMAKLREQTRSDLRRVLDGEQMEEFLLRYSYNAHQLHGELRGFDPSPDEFRKILRATDPIDHQLQLDYGSVEALSEKQRQRLISQRDAAVKEALTPERYALYLLTKDPLYRQAQFSAAQYGAPPKAILPIYEMNKSNDSKRKKIMSDAALTPQQRTEALNALYQEQMRSLQQIVLQYAAQRDNR